ncbi:MAG: AAA family ATPase, partial [Haliea sp.]
DMIADFVDGTEGMLLRDMQAIIQLGKEDRIQPERIRDAVRHFKTGVVDDPWKKIDREKIRNAEQSIRKRLKGQDVAVVHMLDIVKRAITGVGGGKRGGRPRGFALFAGPTGVGKTELAKTITELLFGDENAYIRFDMSEFGAEHADQRLIGAPPGYVGYDQGGQLTNATRERPHAVLLFDEIEKAHPKLLNLFLQILDDGVLTSGRGDRVYFSEAIIIFTSNLGITKFGEQGHRTQNVSQDDCYETVSASIREEIERYFKFTLGRPEILNRFGENIIVFDFIRPDVGKLIFDGMVDGLLKGMAEDGIDVTLSVDVLEALEEVCLKDLQNGGRGIRNQLEAHFVNPLSRAIFDADVESDAVVVDRIVFGEKATTLMVTV